MKLDDLSKHIAKAQQLMLDENFNMMVEARAKIGQKSGNLDGGDMRMFEQMAFGSGYAGNPSGQKPVQRITESDGGGVLNYDKLPECLRESFRETPPIETGGAGASVTDSMKLANISENVRQNIPAQTTNGYVDYSIIKMIVKECVEEAMKSNSHTLRGIKLTEGNKIQLLDTKGNLYEGTVELKRKITKKKN